MKEERSFVIWILWVGILSSVGSFLYPVVRFVLPRKEGMNLARSAATDHNSSGMGSFPLRFCLHSLKLNEVVKFLCTLDETEELPSAASITLSPECLLEEDPPDPPVP